MTRTLARTGFAFAASTLLLAGTITAQSPTIKPGLWESEITVTTNMTLPPEAEARIAALPPEQQAIIRSRMAGGRPTTSTNRSCIAPNTTIDTVIEQAQRNGPMKCTISNKSLTATGGSFDTNCTGEGTTATAHVEFTRTDDEHATGKMHMIMTSTRNGRSMNASSDSTIHYKYLGADCGNVKAVGAPQGH